MADIDNNQLYELNELYDKLTGIIHEMCALADGKHHDLFLQKHAELNIIRKTIEEKKQRENNRSFDML